MLEALLLPKQLEDPCSPCLPVEVENQERVRRNLKFIQCDGRKIKRGGKRVDETFRTCHDWDTIPTLPYAFSYR